MLGWVKLFNRRSCGQGVSQGFLLVILRPFSCVFRDRDCIDVVFFSLLKPFYSKSVYTWFSSSVWGASGPTWIL